ncbi:uncharacterized protein LOC116010303 [Ipomoea triloba]|uniref:uncharacterized protein LOC116010303 n=1 Tax=Ipomoea triloba TaxID=35885 RepID=UPI00125DB0C6|nr:uncharacterized protein LOC116010303 [Ipomoea triloba]
MFCTRDIELIMKIPLSLSFHDQWCWRDDLRGVYAVKHGYKLLTGYATNLNSQFTAWPRLWKLGLPLKILNFVWTCTTLSCRGVNIDILCPLYRLHPETPVHIFRHCQYTCDLWDNYSALPITALDDTFEGWLSCVLSGHDEQLIHACVALCYSIWMNRNDMVFNHKAWSTNEVMRMTTLFLNEWNSPLINNVEPADPNIRHHNSFVQENGSVHIHVDAAVFSDKVEGFISAIVHDGDRRFLGARSDSVRCLHDPILAEATTVKEALSWAKDCGWQKLVIYSDCQLVCTMLRTSSPNLSYTGYVLRDCLSLKRHFVYVSFQFVPRSANTLAHALARATTSGPSTWFTTYPTCIQHLLIHD